jgi:hypothetical protein
MAILTPEEKAFLDVFIHEATTEPFFRGPATKALQGIGVYYSDIDWLNWAYNKECPVNPTTLEWGHAPRPPHRSPGPTAPPPSAATRRSNTSPSSATPPDRTPLPPRERGIDCIAPRIYAPIRRLADGPCALADSR